MQHNYTPQQLQDLCRQVRRDILRMVFAVNSGHPGGSMGCAEIFVALYFKLMRYTASPFNMDGRGEDLFFLSNGHISPVFYSVLARAGFFPVAELATFRKLDSRLQGHPATAEHLPGVRIATGSLGQGLSVAVGAALAKKLNNDDRYVYCLCGDGEINEGQIWEAAMFATHHKVDNLIAMVDWNGKQIDGDTKDVFDTGDLVAKFKAFGWETLLLDKANDLPAVIAAIEQAQKFSGKGKPVVILMRTVMGFGVDFMADDFQWHGKSPNQAQFDKAMAQLPVTTFGDY
jgi:transketolase